MKLTMTIRGLDTGETTRAGRLLERGTGRLERLLEHPLPLRGVVEADGPARRVTLTLLFRGEELNARSTGHDLGVVIATACERLRTQIVKKRRRRATGRQRSVSNALKAS
jgi:ribosome-associated translation inhibitor RaiA